MDQRHINYNMSFEDQHEAVIANVIKKVAVPWTWLTCCRFRWNIPNSMHLNGERGSGLWWEILSAIRDVVCLGRRARRTHRSCLEARMTCERKHPQQASANVDPLRHGIGGGFGVNMDGFIWCRWKYILGIALLAMDECILYVFQHILNNVLVNILDHIFNWLMWLVLTHKKCRRSAFKPIHFEFLVSRFNCLWTK